LKILFCDEGYSEARRRLAALVPAHEIVCCARDAVAQHLGGADVIIPYMAVIDGRIIEAGAFGLIQQFGVGLEGVDIEAATRAGVWVARVPSGQTGNAESVAEHAVLLMLMLARHTSDACSARAKLGEPTGLALWGKTACIIGVGAAGGALATRLTAFGMRLIAVRKSVEGVPPPGVRFEKIYPLAQLSDAVREADFVVITARYEPDAHHLVDRRVLECMRPSAFIVNVARGGFVDRAALESALRSGRIAGAGLDVVEGEPLDPSDPLLSFNVVVTPHIAGVTDVSYAGIARAVAENIRRYESGEAPVHAVNKPLRARGK
jgi:phosphoglycerate dehydrogenase-like enzyme